MRAAVAAYGARRRAERSAEAAEVSAVVAAYVARRQVEHAAEVAEIRRVLKARRAGQEARLAQDGEAYARAARVFGGEHDRMLGGSR